MLGLNAPARAQQATVGQPIGDAARPDTERPREPPPPRRGGGTEAPGQEGDGIDLLPRIPIARAAGWILPDEPPPETREERGREALDRHLRDELHRSTLEKLGAHPWYQGVARRLRKRFQPDMRRLQRERRASMTVLQQVMDELGRYGPPETPVPQAAVRPLELLEGTLSREDVAALRTAEAQNALHGHTTWYHVDVRVTYGPEGQVAAAWIEESSGYRTIDDAALAAARRGDIPAPPAEVVGDRDAIQADWRLEVGDVATPWNQAGCVDDPVHGGLQCHALGRGVSRVRVRLLRVVDATPRSRDRRPFGRDRARSPTSRWQARSRTIAPP